MIKKKTISFYGCVCICLLTASMFTSIDVWAQAGDRPSLEMEVDPLAYLLNGYSLHTAVTYSAFRSSIGIYGIKTPGFLLPNDAFLVYTSGVDLKTDYFFRDLKGFYTGLQLTYSKDRVGLKESNYREDLWGLNIGIRTGYRFMFGKRENQYKGLYLTPWIALMYNPSAKTVQHRNQQYQQASWVPFPTIHIGWRF